MFIFSLCFSIALASDAGESLTQEFVSLLTCIPYILSALESCIFINLFCIACILYLLNPVILEGYCYQCATFAQLGKYPPINKVRYALKHKPASYYWPTTIDVFMYYHHNGNAYREQLRWGTTVSRELFDLIQSREHIRFSFHLSARSCTWLEFRQRCGDADFGRHVASRKARDKIIDYQLAVVNACRKAQGIHSNKNGRKLNLYNLDHSPVGAVPDDLLYAMELTTRDASITDHWRFDEDDDYDCRRGLLTRTYNKLYIRAAATISFFICTENVNP